MLLKSDIEHFCMELERNHPGAPAATTLHHFYTLFREREEQSALIGAMRDALQQAVDYAIEACKAEGMREGQRPTQLTAGEYGDKIAVWDVKAAILLLEHFPASTSHGGESA